VRKLIVTMWRRSTASSPTPNGEMDWLLADDQMSDY
jgi:hypothetical protein